MLIFALIAVLGWRQTVPDSDAELIKLAKSAILSEVLGKPLPKISTHTAPHAVFVTIERNGSVVGCRGDLKPRFSSLEEEVVTAARGAASHDPRYRPLSKPDLDRFLVTVTIVERTERIENVDALSPSDGLVLECGNHKGIVLPWEGKDPNVRLQWAYKKAGVANGTHAALFRLIATRCRG